MPVVASRIITNENVLRNRIVRHFMKGKQQKTRNIKNKNTKK